MSRQPLRFRAGLEGCAYGGLVLFSRSKWRYREYLTTELIRDLAPGEWVCVSAWVTAAEQAGIVADGFGALLSAEKPRRSGISLGGWPSIGEPDRPLPRVDRRVG